MKKTVVRIRLRKPVCSGPSGLQFFLKNTIGIRAKDVIFHGVISISKFFCFKVMMKILDLDFAECRMLFNQDMEKKI